MQLTGAQIVEAGIITNMSMEGLQQQGIDLRLDRIGYLGGNTVNSLINAEADATKVALIDYQRPNVTITLEKVNPYNVGQLLYMLEVQTAITGELYNINTFNQPGVEQAKNYTYALMGRAGYEESAATLKEKMA